MSTTSLGAKSAQISDTSLLLSTKRETCIIQGSALFPCSTNKSTNNHLLVVRDIAKISSTTTLSFSWTQHRTFKLSTAASATTLIGRSLKDTKQCWKRPTSSKISKCSVSQRKKQDNKNSYNSTVTHLWTQTIWFMAYPHPKESVVHRMLSWLNSNTSWEQSTSKIVLREFQKRKLVCSCAEICLQTQNRTSLIAWIAMLLGVTLVKICRTKTD